MARILIADDEEAIRHYLQKTIQMLGHDTLVAPNGKEALDIFKNDTIDLSIVDIKMPKMDGLSFLHSAKEIDPDAVIIIMTGYPSAESIVETIEDDGYTYLAKPIDMVRLQDLIGRGLAMRDKRLGKK
ncbi:response regulator [candidate division KSB1 bacterium]|nr:response regulator [candidate division KSB1 bacterium]